MITTKHPVEMQTQTLGQGKVTMEDVRLIPTPVEAMSGSVGGHVFGQDGFYISTGEDLASWTHCCEDPTEMGQESSVFFAIPVSPDVLVAACMIANDGIGIQDVVRLDEAQVRSWALRSFVLVGAERVHAEMNSSSWKCCYKDDVQDRAFFVSTLRKIYGAFPIIDRCPPSTVIKVPTPDFNTPEPASGPVPTQRHMIEHTRTRVLSHAV